MTRPYGRWGFLSEPLENIGHIRDLESVSEVDVPRAFASIGFER